MQDPVDTQALGAPCVLDVPRGDRGPERALGVLDRRRGREHGAFLLYSLPTPFPLHLPLTHSTHPHTPPLYAYVKQETQLTRLPIETMGRTGLLPGIQRVPRALRARRVRVARVDHAHLAPRVQPSLQHREQGVERADARALEPPRERVQRRERCCKSVARVIGT